MKTAYLTALAMLTVLAFAGVVSADQPDYYYYYQYDQTPAASQSCPACVGAGPGYGTQPVATCPGAGNICNVNPLQCGAFCAAGQQAPGWPYNWCSEYWLRPDSNL